jgi:hypothetical protein
MNLIRVQKPETITANQETEVGLAKRISFLFLVWHNICIALPKSSIFAIKI